jgi:hypothetical protein
MKNSSDTIGNRTHDLPACSAMPQLRHHGPLVRYVFTLNSYMFQPTWGHLQAVHLIEDSSFILCQRIFVFLEAHLDLYINAYKYTI